MRTRPIPTNRIAGVLQQPQFVEIFHHICKQKIEEVLFGIGLRRSLSRVSEISVKQLLDEGLSEYAADEITKISKEQLPNPNIRNCVQIGCLVKNEPNIGMAIADEIQNFKEYGDKNGKDEDSDTSGLVLGSHLRGLWVY
jgi:hypothetical protein